MNPRRRATQARIRRQSGLSHVEVLIATALIATALVPALDALHAGLETSRAYEERAVDHFRVRGRLESVLAESFDTLEAQATAAGGPTTPTAASDPAGTPRRLLVYTAGWDADELDGDGDRFTGADEGLLWVRVAVESGSPALEVLTTR